MIIYFFKRSFLTAYAVNGRVDAEKIFLHYIIQLITFICLIYPPVIIDRLAACTSMNMW